MTTTRVFSSTDTGAPALTGQVGTLTNLLKKCLVDGYGNTQPAGWTAPFTGGNKVVLRNAPAAGATGHYFRIQDDGADSLSTRVAWLRGYVDMSDVDTPVGSDVMPRTDWHPNGHRWLKSSTTDTTSRAWMVWADEMTCWFWADISGSGLTVLYGFGDIESFVAHDAFRSFVCGALDNATASSPRCGIGGGSKDTMPSASTENDEVICLMKGYSGTGASVACGVASIASRTGSASQSVSGGRQAPMEAAIAPGIGQRVYCPAYVVAENSLRGRLRGLNYLMNEVTPADDGTLDINAHGMPGSKLRIKSFYRASKHESYFGAVGIEEALPW